MRTKSMITRIICVLIAAVLLASFSLSVFAEAEANKKQYIKDVKLIYAESLDEARPYVPNGYTLLENDLNAGADSDNMVYFAYSTTTNPDEAVTDIKMMNMKGGFVLSDYEEQMKNVKDSVKKLGADVKMSAELFAENYVKGTYGAKAAYRALSAFTVDEADGMTLADYIIYKKPSEEFYIKFVLNVHKDVLSAVISALTMAVQGERGNTWLDRLAKVENPKTEELPSYWNNAEDLWEQFCGFYDVYVTINHALYDGTPPEAPKEENKGEDEDAAPPVPEADPETQPEVEYNGTEALYEVVYRTLKSYKFGNGVTFSEWFLSDEVFDDEIIENFFVILSVMTPEELAMLRLSGPLYTVLSTGMDEAAYNEYVKSIDEATGGAPACSIWAGVNTELFHSSIGITDDAARRIAETEYERELNNDGDSTAETGLKTAGLIAACGAVALGLSMVTYYSLGSLMFTCFSGFSLTTAATVVSVGAQIFMMTSLALGVVAVVVALVVAIIFFFVWLDDLIDEYHPDYTEIPEYMYDYVEDGAGNNQFVLYESVKFQDGRIADVNTWEGKEWHAMYTSHDKAAGAPIEADVVVKYGNGEIDKGFAGLSNFGHVNAQNLNAYDFDDDVDGVYVTYRQADLEGDYARKPYLSDVKLFSGEEPEKVKNDLMDEGYVCHEVNLTPNSEDYITYLGYKTTNNASRALTDIRLAYGYNSKQYNVGAGSNATYAASGSTADGMLTLYITSISQFGTPIRSDFLILNDRNAPAGYEPVNLFVGGPAVNLNLRDEKYVDSETSFYLYFLPTKAYKSGTQYISGLTMIYDQATKTGDNGAESVDNASKALGYTILHKTKSKNTLEGALAYTTTYNPYRAIYAISAIKESDAVGHEFSKTMTYDGIGYSLVDRFVVTVDGNIRFEYYTDSTADGRLYTSGIYQGGKALTLADLHVSADATAVPEGFYPVSSRLSSDGRAVDLAKGFYRQFRNSHAGGQPTTFSFESFFLFVKGEGYKEGNFLTDLYIVSKEQLLDATKDEKGERMDIDCDDLDNAYVMDQLAALGAHTAILKNLNLEDSDNLTYLGYTKKAKDKKSATLLKPITNIVLYYAGETDAIPASEMEFDRISYTLVGNVNLFCEEEGTSEECERVYLYYTTNPAAGSSIIDIKIDDTPILNGWETVITQNKKALYNDMDDYESSMWFIHVKRNETEPKYISEVVVGVGGSEADAKAVLLAAGCDYMLEKDFNNNVGAHSDYVFIGYKRTNNPSEAIRDLKTTHDNEVDAFVQGGATYYKIDGNLNSYTNVFADDIFLYYTKDAKAGTPLVSLGTSASVANWSHGDGGRYVVKTVTNTKGKYSDLNAGAGGDYIYLLQTRDKGDEKALASIMGEGSVIAIIGFAVAAAAAIAIVCIIYKKRRVSANGAPQESVESQEDGDSE